MNSEKEYIPYMRKMIGSKRMISVGLCCLLINEKNEILLEKRSDNSLYCLPGGSIDFDETVIEGVKREVKEETGISLDKVELMMILSGNKEQFKYPNGDVTDYVDLIFYSNVNSKEINLNNKHDDESLSIKFYSINELPSEDEFLRGTDRIIEKFKKNDFTLEVD